MNRSFFYNRILTCQNRVVVMKVYIFIKLFSSRISCVSLVPTMFYIKNTHVVKELTGERRS
jgi:hypothetical protein